MADPAPAKVWWKSRVLWLALAQIAVGVIAMPHLGLPAGTAITLKGILDIILRVLTTAPIEGVRSD
jgi:hypothetical protein